MPKTLKEVNSAVNETCTYVSDQEQFGVPEYWEDALKTHKGDCEDAAIAKCHMLLADGFPREMLKLGLCHVETGEYHCVLVATQDGEDWVLDNRYPFPMRWQEVPYVWEKFYLLGEGVWRTATV